MQRDTAYSKPEDGRPEIPFRAHYPDLWVAYADLRRYLLPWKRKALENAWNKYIHAEY